jgi:methionine synthase II (cobalamin-independent)
VPRRRGASHCRDRQGTRGHHRADGIAPLLRLRLCRPRQAERLRALPELTASKVEQISIEAAQPNLDLTTLDGLGDKTVIFGVINMGDPEPETPETVAARIRAALRHLPPERLIPAPDCCMKYIPRDLAFAKLKALAEGAAIVRRELTGG